MVTKHEMHHFAVHIDPWFYQNRYATLKAGRGMFSVTNILTIFYVLNVEQSIKSLVPEQFMSLPSNECHWTLVMIIEHWFR